MKLPDHKAALYTAENCQDIPEYQNNLAAAYLDLREKAKAFYDGGGRKESEALREILEEK